MSLDEALCWRTYNSYGVALISRLGIFFVGRRERAECGFQSWDETSRQIRKDLSNLTTT